MAESRCKNTAVNLWKLTDQIFISFNLWAGLFCLFNTIIQVVDMAVSGHVDPQKIVLIVM